MRLAGTAPLGPSPFGEADRSNLARTTRTFSRAGRRKWTLGSNRCRRCRRSTAEGRVQSARFVEQQIGRGSLQLDDRLHEPAVPP
jgi:hypothetical protein